MPGANDKNEPLREGCGFHEIVLDSMVGHVGIFVDAANSFSDPFWTGTPIDPSLQPARLDATLLGEAR